MSPTHTGISGDMDEDLELAELALNQSNVYQQFSTDLKKKFQVGHTRKHTFILSAGQENKQHVIVLLYSEVPVCPQNAS